MRTYRLHAVVDGSALVSTPDHYHPRDLGQVQRIEIPEQHTPTGPYSDGSPVIRMVTAWEAREPHEALTVGKTFLTFPTRHAAAHWLATGERI